MTVSHDDAIRFVGDRLCGDPTSVRPAGAGQWSVCFAFTRDGDALVVRFGRQLVDFEMDRYARRWHGPGLPIPEVTDIGEAFDGHYAVSTFVPGTALEQVGAEQWNALVPAVADCFEAMRTTSPGIDGFGPLFRDRRAGGVRTVHPTWHDYLLAVRTDLPSMRIHGWRAKLDTRREASRVFDAGLEILTGLDLGVVPPSIVHADLINRNVHVVDERITGVFDWGSFVVGDHVYEIAAPEFYAPHHPRLDIAALADELRRRWTAADVDLSRLTERRTAAHLHVGLIHFAYNAWLEDWRALDLTVERTRALVPDLR